MEVGQTMRKGIGTGEYLANWVIEYNLFENHLQKNAAFIDLKSGGHALRFNIAKNANGAVDARTGSCNKVTSNDFQGAKAGMGIYGGYHEYIGNKAPSLYTLSGATTACANKDKQATLSVELYGNIAPVTVGKFYDTSTPIPSDKTVVAQNTGSVTLQKQTNTTTIPNSPKPIPPLPTFTKADVGLEGLKTVETWPKDPGVLVPSCQCVAN